MKVRRGVAELAGRRAAYVVLLALSQLVTSVLTGGHSRRFRKILRSRRGMVKTT